MIDIKLARENPDLVRKNLEWRKNPKKMKLLEELIEFDTKWRHSLQKLEKILAKKNSLTQEIEQLKNEGKDFKKKIIEAKNIVQEIKIMEKNVAELREKVDYCLLRIPNLLHDSVPFGENDADNVQLKKWGKIVEPFFPLKHHGEIALTLNQADFERAVKISGTGFFALKNELLLLDLALQRLALDSLSKKGFQLIQPPFLMQSEPYTKVTDLDFFSEQLYKTEENLFLIATSEHPIAAMHSNEIFEEKQLPLKYAGVSPCFRKEIGKHGLDERGFFRVHQFNKVEQFVFCAEEQSWKLFEEIARNSEELLEALEIPYERVAVCTGDIGDIASKKYDLNGWSSREKKYIELMSCSNCSDYQARSLNIKYRKGNEKFFVHTLNNTMIATTRLLRILIEHYQTKDGDIRIPKILQPYLNGLREITKK